MLVEHRFTDPESAAAWLADELARQLRAGLHARGAASLVVSGGRSPVALFGKLRDEPLDWSRVWITLADERWADSGSVDSNERLLREHLLVGPAAAAHLVPLKTAVAAPTEALAERGAALAAMPRPFDAVLLGMGEDGHTASLFPGARGLEPALDPNSAVPLAAIDPPRAPHPRLSLTLSALLDSRRIALQIQGKTKLEVYVRARSGVSPLKLPIAAVLDQSRVPVVVALIGC